MAAITLSGSNFLGDFTFANLPSASSVRGDSYARVTNIGATGSIWMSDGTRWHPMNGSVTLLQTGIPMVIPSSGSIADNGALSGLTALPETISSCYMYFPANAIAAGVAAGLYYVVMSSTTAGTIYNNTYTSGNPTIPSSPTAFATTGPGAYTQTTGSDITVLSYAVIANSMGANGKIEADAFAEAQANNANAKTLRIKFGGSTNLVSTTSVTSNLTCQVLGVIRNRGVTNKQVNHPAGSAPFGGIGTAATRATNDTTANQDLTVTLQLATATDSLILHGATFRLVTQ